MLLLFCAIVEATMSISLIAAARRARGFRPIALPSVEHESTVLPPSVVRRGMQLGLVEGMLAQVHLSLTNGTLATGLALLLGAGSFALSILAAMPVLGALLQFPTAWWVERYGNRRNVSVVGTLGRQLWLVPAGLLFLPLPLGIKLGLFLFAAAIGYMLLAIASNAWTGWMTDLIPPSVRGRYFGALGGLMGGVAMVVGYGGAWLVDRGKVAGMEAATYAGLLLLAAICGGAGSFVLSRQPEPPMVRGPRRSLHELLVMPMRHRVFRAFAGTFVL